MINRPRTLRIDRPAMVQQERDEQPVGGLDKALFGERIWQVASTSAMPTFLVGIALLCIKLYALSAWRGLFNRRKATRAMLSDRTTPMAKVICGVIQGPTSA